MIKRWILLILAAIILSIFSPGLAEPDTAKADDILELARMIPVLDSFAQVMDLNGDITYSPEDPGFIWTTLHMIGVNWYDDGSFSQDGSAIVIPSSVMNDYATAAFADLSSLPAFPLNNSFVGFDPFRGVYILVPIDHDNTYVMIERFASQGTDRLVGFGLYDDEINLRLGGFTAILTPNVKVLQPTGFPFSVKDVHAEENKDFAGLTPTLCAIRYEEIAQTSLTSEYQPLSQGSRGEDVARLQHRLNELGYACGIEDGIFGGRTRQAVRYFQDALGLPQDGVASPELQEQLFSEAAPSFVRFVTLYRGSTGIRVEQLQYRLRALGYLAEPAEGFFGTRTEKAVQLFQRTIGLTQDGVAGSQTLAALEDSEVPACRHYIDLYPGDTGDRVIEMQKLLIRLGLLYGKPTGTYDQATAKAVEQFMKSKGIKGDSDMAAADTVQALADSLEVTPYPEHATDSDSGISTNPSTEPPSKSSFDYPAPTANVESGVYIQPVTLVLTAEAADEIRFTLNGETATAESTLYTRPLVISSGSVSIRAVAVYGDHVSEEWVGQFTIQ